MDQNYQTEDGTPKRWVVLTAEILCSKELSNTDKIVLAYISSFDEFYASNESTADFLGLTARTVMGAKQKLERLGYITVLKNTGRGKIYQFDTGRLTKKCQSDLQKSVNQTYKKVSPENKDKIKKKENGADNEKSEYGRHDLNELVQLWQAETHIDISREQHQRRQLYNLVRKYGLEPTKTLIKRVGTATRSPDRFAPQIATPGDLTGKYSKLPKLELWEQRNAHAKPFGTPLPLRKANTDYNGAWDEQTDSERAEVSEMMKQARAKLNI